jgi:hypothetical protein
LLVAGVPEGEPHHPHHEHDHDDDESEGF